MGGVARRGSRRRADVVRPRGDRGRRQGPPPLHAVREPPARDRRPQRDDGHHDASSAQRSASPVRVRDLRRQRLLWLSAAARSPRLDVTATDVTPRRDGSSIETYTCNLCGVSVERRRARGQRPKWCPDCRPKGPRSRRNRDHLSEYYRRRRRDQARRRLRRAARGSSGRRPLIAGSCAVCRRPTTWTARTAIRLCCSPRCVAELKRRDGRRRAMARQRGVFERDGWMCWICGRATDRAAAVPDPDAATVDHVRPLTLGGSDDEDNLRTAHFVCNSSRRGDGGGG